MHIGFLITNHVLHFLYSAWGKWYFQWKISPFGLIQAGHTKSENEVSLSMGIVEKIWNMFCDQEANVHIWLNSRMFWFFRLTLVVIGDCLPGVCLLKNFSKCHQPMNKGLTRYFPIECTLRFPVNFSIIILRIFPWAIGIQQWVNKSKTGFYRQLRDQSFSRLKNHPVYFLMKICHPRSRK